MRIKKSYRFISLLVIAVFAFGSIAKAEIKPISKPIKTQGNVRTYLIDRSPEASLTVDVFLPPYWAPGQNNPAFLLEPGMSGNREENRAFATYLASRGLVAIDSERAIQQAKISTIDCKDSMLWMRMNSKELGIDPDRVVAGGGSGGAACVVSATFSQLKAKNEDLSISSHPNALVLFFPSQILAENRVAGSTFSISDVEAVLEKKSIPAIFFYGTKDDLMSQGLEVARRMAVLGNQTEFYTAEGQGHGFIMNRNGPSLNSWAKTVMYQTDIFLQSLGYLKGKPIVNPDTKYSLKKLDLLTK